MAEQVRIKNTGLRGVTVADSKISFIDGEKGVLIYRGFRIEELAEKSTFMETAYLLLNGIMPNRAQLEHFSGEIVKARRVPGFIFENMKRWPKDARPMDVLQAAVPLLAMADPDPAAGSRREVTGRAMGLIARLPALVAGWHRIRTGREPLDPDEGLDHAANFLWMLDGQRPDPELARTLDICLILHADHTFNASTFACREVVSTRAKIYAGVTAGLGALSGSLHGGANTEVMKMLLRLRDEPDAEAWVRERLAAGERIMGIGHAVYKTGDPRARILRRMSGRLARVTGQDWPVLSDRIEGVVLEEFKRRGRVGLLPNLDFHAAPVYYMLGIPVDLMTPVFAMSRVAGWSAHILEEVFAEAQEKAALYRPKAEYIGEYCGLMGCDYQDLSERT
ncbi:MAG: citrate (Si)-synthase [Proteobacteria bacterium]|nr:citrate (Si)-synthase [Pseudomonadota bacterium]